MVTRGAEIRHISGPAGRVAVLLGLVVAAIVMLRGQIPGARPAPREPASESPASAAGIVTLLAASMIVMAIALVASLRNPPAARPGRRGLPRSGGGDGGAVSRRFLLIALALAIAWLLAFVLFSQLTVTPSDIGPPPRVPAPEADPGTGPPARPSGRGDGGVFGYLMATTVAFAVMVVTAAVVAARRRQRPVKEPLAATAPAPAPRPAEPEVLAVAAERGLAEVANLSRDPRAAIIACYAAMERALAGSPESAPQDSDTPSEVLARAVRHRALGADTATALVDLFTEARFSRHTMTETHREVAERALRRVLDELRAPA